MSPPSGAPPIFGFRPALVPTLFVIASVFILFNLGTWQLRRHSETQARTAEIEAQLHGEPVRGEGLFQPAGSLAWRLAEVQGTYLDLPHALITGRFERGEPGYDIVLPLQAEDGPLVLINRGWLPADGFEEALRATLPSGPVTVRGLIQPVDGDPDASPIPADATHPERWRRPNYLRMSQKWGIAPHLVIVEGKPLQHPDDKDLRNLPITGFVARPRLRPHLEYAGTWFLIGIALIGLWLYAGVQRARRIHEAESASEAAAP